MKLYRITTCDYVHDLSGEGAYLYGGRWNSKGMRMLYTAESMALSMLEALAHITMVNQKRAYCRVVIGIGDGLVRSQPGSERLSEVTDELANPKEWLTEVDTDQLPADWRSSPGPDRLKEIGDAFISAGKFFALKVPSVLAPDSFNYLLNPKHPLFGQLFVLHSEEVKFDQRLALGISKNP